MSRTIYLQIVLKPYIGCQIYKYFQRKVILILNLKDEIKVKVIITKYYFSNLDSNFYNYIIDT